MFAHLKALQGIADANDGNRSDGTSGFEASAEYVAKILRDKGFDVSTPEFERLDSLSPGKPTLTIGGRGYPVDQASLLLQTPVGGVSGPVLRPTAPAGCAAGDYQAGAAQRRDCRRRRHRVFGGRQAERRCRGGRGGTGGRQFTDPERQSARLFETGYYDRLTIPVAVANAEVGAAMRRATVPVRLLLDGRTVKVKSRNMLAQTKTGSASNVVMVGAHLDSPSVGPGMNDNGSGVAAVLETALQLGASPAVPNAVRFAFWGGSKDQLAGSIRYVAGLDRDELNAIALYLNFDELASPNAGYFTLDGDQSGPVSPAIDPDEVPVGSAGVERTLAGYLNLAGKRPADMPLGVASDDSPFLHAGVPIGGTTTGAAQIKSKTQARLWGGDAGVAFDPNYGTAQDDLGAVNRDALAVMGAGVAFAVGTYAASLDGVNGVPPPVQRHRAPMGP